VVAFSCKQRGLCPSCSTRRSHETAAHCGEVLPEVAYRQWTLSAPYAVRWALRKHPKLLARMEHHLVRAVWWWQRRRARRLEYSAQLWGGAVGFRQSFGSSLQLTPHLHVLVPEGMWTAEGEQVALPPPGVEDVEWVLRRVVRQLEKDFAEVGEAWPEDGLERLCRYGSRGPVALERLSRREDGRYEYRTRKGQALVFTAAELVKRMVALLPPQRGHLTRFHGVFAPNAKLRCKVVRPLRPQVDTVQQEGWGCAKEGVARRPRLDWATLQRRTFEADVWQCPCGGRRQVVAVISNRRTAEEVLRNLRLLAAARPVPRTEQAPPQLAFAL
jgi:hypothetical protein